MSRTGIEWTEFTWNPFVGCNVHSAGCTNCYAMAMAARLERFGTAPQYAGTTRIMNGRPVWSGRLNRASDAGMRKPLGIREPARIFVNSMADYFHEGAPDAWRIEALDVMQATPRHSYQVLTKRPENILPFLERTGAVLPANTWIGATVERADVAWRIDVLRRVPARIRFLSIEPLIGPIGRLDLAGIHWVIVGGESGPGARPMRAAWLCEVIEQCTAQGVATFFKQWGKISNNPIYHEPPDHRSPLTGAARVEQLDPIGKGGSTLSGRRWVEYPED